MPANVKFILGRSGSGKTSAIIDEITRREARGEGSVLIVPDRVSFETELLLSRAIGEATGGAGGMLHTSVVSFTRLAHRVLSETGNSRAYLSSEGRLMLIRRILDENKAALSSFARVCSHRGFAEECDEIILKCKRFSITPDALFDADVPERLKHKLRDFALIYRKLTERMEQRYIDGEDLINALIERIPASSLRGAAVFIDAPDMLNEQSVRIIEKLFYTASSVIVSFRADTVCREANGGLFLPDVGYYEKLLRLAAEAGCNAETLRLFGNRRHASPALAYLETTLFAPQAGRFTQDAREIELHSSVDVMSEVGEAAARIIEAVRNGMRFREIAVAASDISAYAEPVRRVFSAAGIPAFTDAKRRVATHPVSELILAALRCVEKGFQSEDFIRVMKTGLTDFPDTTLEKLENHILKLGLMGKRLVSSEPSVKNAEKIKDFDEIEAARAAIAQPLAALKERIGEDGSRSARTRVLALYAFLEDMQTAQKLKQRFETLKASPETLAYALENRQIYDTVIELLDQIMVILGDEAIGLARFSAVVREGLEAYEVGIIPPTLDQVLVGDVSSIHPGEPRLLIVLGANEGRFPSMRADNSIINDRELEQMREAGIRAWESTQSMDSAERLRVYSLLCRARERLFISFRREQSDPTGASRLVKRIGELMPHCTRTSHTVSPSAVESDRAAFSVLASALRRFIDTGVEEAGLAPLYAHFHASEKYAPLLCALEQAYYRDEFLPPLGADAARMLYGASMSGSVSRLETYNKCPYRHLLQYGLKLNERETHEIRGNEFGTLVHEALEKLVRGYINDINADPEAGEALLQNITREDVELRLNALLTDIAADFNHGILLESATMRSALESIRRELIDAGFAIMRQLAGGSFRPRYAELSFGDPSDKASLPALEIESGDGAVFHMRGVVDRLDSYTAEGGEGGEAKEFFRIVDYKTYSSPFSFSDLENGLKVQLPLYALAVKNGLEGSGKASPAGMYYQHIHAPAVEDEEKRDEVVLKELKLSGPTLHDNGVLAASDAEVGSRSSRFIVSLALKDGEYKGNKLVSPEEMEKTLERARQVAGETLGRIMQGGAAISPYRCGTDRACKSCPYGSVCRFDTTAGDRYRSLKKVSTDKFFNREPKK